MEIYQLRTFVAVAQLGHLTRAAEKLHISQPAVSTQIKALEETLGVPLFHRSPSGITITRAGQMLVPLAEQLLRDAQELRNQAKQLQGMLAGKVKLGSIVDPETLHLGEILSCLVAEHPMVEVDVEHSHSGMVQRRVRDGELDGGFFIGDAPGPGVDSIRLCSLCYRVAAPPAMEDDIRGADAAALVRLPWVVIPSTASHFHMIRKVFGDLEFTPSRHIESDQEAIIVNLVKSGVGLGLIRDGLAEEAARAGEVVLWDGPKLESSLWFLYAPSKVDDPLIAALLHAIRLVWKLESSPETLSR